MSPPLKRSRSNQGFTLIEMLIAIGITVVVMASVFQILHRGQESFRREPEVAEMTANARAGLDMEGRVQPRHPRLLQRYHSLPLPGAPRVTGKSPRTRDQSAAGLFTGAPARLETFREARLARRELSGELSQSCRPERSAEHWRLPLFRIAGRADGARAFARPAERQPPRSGAVQSRTLRVAGHFVRNIRAEDTGPIVEAARRRRLRPRAGYRRHYREPLAPRLCLRVRPGR